MDDRTLPAGEASLSRQKHLSIRALMFLLVLVVLLPAAAVAAWYLSVQLQQARETAADKVKLMADGAAAVLQLTLNDQQMLLERFARRPKVWALNAEDFDPVLADYARLHPEFNNLGVRDLEGRLVFSARPGPANPPEQFREFPWFKEGIAIGRFQASDAFLGTLSGRWVTVLTQPVRDERGHVVGLINLSQDLLALNQRVLGSVPANAIVAVTDRQGRYLLRSAEAETWLGKSARMLQETVDQREGFLTAPGPDGVARVYAFVTMPYTGWRVVAGLPQDEVFATYQAMLRRGAAIALGIMLLALFAAWRVGRGIVGPIHALSRAAARIAAGDGAARADVDGPAEIRAVAHEFNQMVQSRARSEAALRDSETSLAITLESIGDAVIATNVKGGVTRMNAAAQRLTGWRGTEAVGRPLAEVFRIVDAKTRQPMADPAQAALRGGQVVGLADHTVLLARDGCEYQIADSAAPILDHAGHAVGVVLVFSDVTERYRVEQDLRSSNEILRLRDLALAEISQGVMITDAQSRITYVNRGFERLTGYGEAEVLGRTPKFLQGEATSAETVAKMSQALRAGRGFHGEILNFTKAGEKLWLALDISPLRDGKGELTGFVGAQRDITERKQAESMQGLLEARLRESQKMESIGTLAGGIAHDFNNVLGAILGNLTLARDEVGPGHPSLKSLEQINRASLRARDLVQQILAFSRRQPQVLRVQALQPIVHEAVALLRSALPAMVELSIELQDAPLHVNADATQMQQVLMNLCTNAWHALQGSPGRITISLDEVWLDATQAAALGPLAAGRYAHLRVADNGIGMDEATLSRIFEPFFTTKATGYGTGLGMSVVHGIVSAHSGGIKVSSSTGEGTRVDLHFPLGEAPSPGGRAQPVALVADEAQPGRGERVLYADDDEVMRLVVERMLQRAGWQAHCAATAEEALQVLGSTRIDLVVTDFNMPGPSGLDLAQAVARLQPALPVVIVSGYLTDELRHGATLLGVRQVLQKQNLFEELAPTVRRILSEVAVARVS
jgi:PAS domain S-box-containing protein